MAERGTNTSPPEERSMNPNPFSLLNHFTFPCSLLITLRLLLRSSVQLQHATKCKQSGIILKTHGVSTFKRINKLAALGSIRGRRPDPAETHAGRGIRPARTPALQLRLRPVGLASRPVCSSRGRALHQKS